MTTLTLRIAQRGRRALVALTLALIVLGWAASQRAQADAVAIPGTPETVYADSLGQVQGRFTGASDGIFFSPSSNTGAAGFFVGIPAGVGQPPALLSSGSGQVFGFTPAAGPTFDQDLTAVSGPALSGSGSGADPYKLTTTFNVVGSDTNPYLQIAEVVAYVNGDSSFSVTYTVKNASAVGIKFRAMFGADLFVEGADVGTGVFSPGPPRFLGGQNPAVGRSGGHHRCLACLEPLSGGLLQPDLGPPEDQWSGCRRGRSFQGYGSSGFPASDPTQAPGAAGCTTHATNPYGDGVDPNLIDNGLGVEWDGNMTAALAAGASTTFVVNPRNSSPAPLVLTPPTQTQTIGRPATLAVSARDFSGNPEAGIPVHFNVAGANTASGTVPTSGQGAATITYTGAAPGADTVTAFLDFNGDGVRQATEPQATAAVTYVVVPPAPPHCGLVANNTRASRTGAVSVAVRCDAPALLALNLSGKFLAPKAKKGKHAKKASISKKKKRKVTRRKPIAVVLNGTGTTGANLTATITVQLSGSQRALLTKIKRFGFSYLLAAKGIGGVTATKGSYTVSPSQPAKKSASTRLTSASSR